MLAAAASSPAAARIDLYLRRSCVHDGVGQGEGGGNAGVEHTGEDQSGSDPGAGHKAGLGRRNLEVPAGEESGGAPGRANVTGLRLRCIVLIRFDGVAAENHDAGSDAGLFGVVVSVTVVVTAATQVVGDRVAHHLHECKQNRERKTLAPTSDKSLPPWC